MVESNLDALKQLWAEMDEIENDIDELDPSAGHPEAGQVDAADNVAEDEDALRDAQAALSAKEAEAKELIENNEELQAMVVTFKLKGLDTKKMTPVDLPLNYAVIDLKLKAKEVLGTDKEGADIIVKKGKETLPAEWDSLRLFKVGFVNPNTVISFE